MDLKKVIKSVVENAGGKKIYQVLLIVQLV